MESAATWACALPSCGLKSSLSDCLNAFGHTRLGLNPIMVKPHHRPLLTQPLLVTQAEKASKDGKGKEKTKEKVKGKDNAYSGPHTVWDSLTERGGDAAAAREDKQMAQALAQAIGQDGIAGEQEMAAAMATQEMADAASGVMAEASRLASDIMTAGAPSWPLPGFSKSGRSQVTCMLTGRQHSSLQNASLGFRAQEICPATRKPAMRLYTCNHSGCFSVLKHTARLRRVVRKRSVQWKRSVEKWNGYRQPQSHAWAREELRAGKAKGSSRGSLCCLVQSTGGCLRCSNSFRYSPDSVLARSCSASPLRLLILL